MDEIQLLWSFLKDRKTEAVGGCGVEADDPSGSKAPPIGYVP
jgi:hypothetical protein